MIKIQEDFIKNLKFYRKERDASQAKLAEACNCATLGFGGHNGVVVIKKVK
ncbi:MAG: hypothetical protein K6A42_09800 [Treponema sp.]|nr:hypothetical protein [Treponema sp.]